MVGIVKDFNVTKSQVYHRLNFCVGVAWLGTYSLHKDCVLLAV